MERPILYSFRRCPYAMRARLALLASGTICTHREIILRDKPAAMLEASPKGTVPVLIRPDGSVLEESLDVAFWALKSSDPHGWLKPWQEDPANADHLLERNDGSFKHHLDRYKYANRYENEDGEAHRAAGLEVLADLNARLEGSGYLHGEAFSFLDASIAPFIRQFRIPEPEWFDDLPLPALKSWLNAFLGREDFQMAMKKYQVWKPGDDPQTFPKLD